MKDLLKRVLAAHFGVVLFSSLGSAVAAADLPLCQDAWRRLPPQSRSFDPKRHASYAAYAAPLNRARCQKEWAVLVFMAADNDLEPYALKDLYEMEAGYESGTAWAGSTARADVLVELDRKGEGERAGLHRYHLFQQPEVYSKKAALETREVRSPEVMRLPEHGQALGREAEERLQNFLAWAAAEYPARRTLVVVWGHGRGWAADAVPGQTAPGFGGMAFDDSDQSYLSTQALARVLKLHPVDVYASDACLMQMAEVASEIAPYARFVVGSTQVQNFLGLPYRRILYELNSGRLARNTDPDAARIVSRDEAFWVARMIPRLLKASFAPNGLQRQADGARRVMLSSLSGAELDHQLVPRVATLARALRDWLNDDPMRAIDLQGWMASVPPEASVLGGNQDLGVWVRWMKQQILNSPELASTATSVLRALDGVWDAVQRSSVLYALGTDFTATQVQMHLLGFRALSVWIPTSAEEWQLRRADFAKSQFYRRTGWAEWLDLVLQ